MQGRHYIAGGGALAVVALVLAVVVSVPKSSQTPLARADAAAGSVETTPPTEVPSDPAPAPTTTTAVPTTTTTTTTAPPPPQNGDLDGDGWVRVDEDPVARLTHASAVPVVPEERNVAVRNGAVGFTVNCPVFGSATHDPIVFPGDTERSHLHDFFGNKATDHTTSSTDLYQQTDTSCPASDDLSAYWFPALYDNGKKIEPKSTSFYYKMPLVSEMETLIQPYPPGFRMIAGNAAADGPQSHRIGWFEEHRNNRNHTGQGANATMITASESGKIIAKVEFPACWDGLHLDSPDHKSHVAYSFDWACPNTHPVPLPRLVAFVTYDVPGGAGITLASGEWFTIHADFWNGWNPDALQHLIDTCIIPKVHCDRVADA